MKTTNDAVHTIVYWHIDKLSWSNQWMLNQRSPGRSTLYNLIEEKKISTPNTSNMYFQVSTTTTDIISVRFRHIRPHQKLVSCHKNHYFDDNLKLSPKLAITRRYLGACAIRIWCVESGIGGKIHVLFARLLILFDLWWWAPWYEVMHISAPLPVFCGVYYKLLVLFFEDEPAGDVMENWHRHCQLFSLNGKRDLTIK